MHGCIEATADQKKAWKCAIDDKGCALPQAKGCLKLNNGAGTSKTKSSCFHDVKQGVVHQKGNQKGGQSIGTFWTF